MKRRPRKLFTNGDIAAELVRAGRCVVPLRYNGVPLVKNEFHDGTRSEAMVQLWWERWPSAHIGIVDDEVPR